MRRLLGLFAIIVAATSSWAVPASGIAGFGDVRASDYWSDAVQWMVDHGITTGTSPTCFSPEDPVTRGQAAAFMWRMQGEPRPNTQHPFVDVVSDWQQDAVAWMAEQNITTGTTPHTYSPNDSLTRGQLAALLHRLAGTPAASGHPFVDVTSRWQETPVAWMVDNDITTGTSPRTFSPNDTVTRGQLATFFHRYKGSPAVSISSSSPSCGNGAAPTGGSGTAQAMTPGAPVRAPVDCRVRAGEVWSPVWFNLFYNAGSPSCERPVFVASGSARVVDRNHPSASDTNPGTAALPWRTMVHAANTARSGDVVYVKAGVYDDGRIEPRTDGVVFASFPGDEHEAVLKGWGIRAISASDIVVYGFQIRDVANNGVQVIGPGAHDVVIANNLTVNTALAGVSIRGGLPDKSYRADGVRDVLIVGNDVRRANLVNSEVISVGSGVDTVHVVGNRLTEGAAGSGGQGIALKNGVRTSAIYGNVVAGLDDRGIHIDGGDSGAMEWNALIADIDIFDNVLHGNTGQGLWVTSEGEGDVDGVRVHHNIAYGNGADGFLVYDHPDGQALGGSTRNIVFEFNTAFGNGEHGSHGGFALDHGRTTGIVFRNNIAWGNTGIGIRVKRGSATVDTNLCAEAVCEINGDPRFVDAPGDLRLRPGSPAVGAATNGADVGAH